MKLDLVKPLGSFSPRWPVMLILGLCILALILVSMVGCNRKTKKKYLEIEMGSDFIEKTEVKPISRLPLTSWQIIGQNGGGMNSSVGRVRRATYLADSHWNLKISLFAPPGSMAGLTIGERLAKAASFGKTAWQEPGGEWKSFQPMPGSEYARRTCEECHPRQTRDIHTTRVKKTCRQCHGPEPIAGVNHYHSIMNSNRRHIFVCSKCHEGASDSFAQYRIHAPFPASLKTLEEMPILFFVFWFMVAIAAGTFAVFLPHTVLWGIRELFIKKDKHDSEHS